MPTVYERDTDLELTDDLCGYKFQIINNQDTPQKFKIRTQHALQLTTSLSAFVAVLALF